MTIKALYPPSFLIDGPAIRSMKSRGTLAKLLAGLSVFLISATESGTINIPLVTVSTEWTLLLLSLKYLCLSHCLTSLYTMITGQLFDNEAIPYLSFTFNNKIIHAESSNKIIFHRKITVRSCFVSINVSLISGLKRYNLHKMPACFDDRGQHIYWCYLLSYKSVHLTGEYGTIKMAKSPPKRIQGYTFKSTPVP